MKARFGLIALLIFSLVGCSKPKPLWLNSQVKFYIGDQGSCSLTVISTNRAITAAHCLPIVPTPLGIMELPDVMHLEDGRVLKIETIDIRLDRAMVSGDFSGFIPAEVDFDSAEMFKVEAAIVCGYPGRSKELRCTLAKRVRNEAFEACFDVTLLPGQSGGGVFSLDGKLIGINQRVTEDGISCVNTPTGMVE